MSNKTNKKKPKESEKDDKLEAIRDIKNKSINDLIVKK